MIDTTAMEASEWASLNDRQRAQAGAVSELATEFGMFDQSSGANGAHYAPGAKNPFKAEGLKCGNCIFFNEENSQCQIVAGVIESDAVCKLWIIPETVLAPQPVTRAELGSMTPQEIMDAKAQGRLDSLLGK